MDLLPDPIYEMLCLSRLTYAVVKVLLKSSAAMARTTATLNPASAQPHDVTICGNELRLKSLSVNHLVHPSALLPSVGVVSGG